MTRQAFRDNPFPLASHADPDVDPPVFAERNGEFSDLMADARDYLVTKVPGPRASAAPIMVIGASGAGKTYLLAHLYHQVRKVKLHLAQEEGVPPTEPFLLFVRRPLQSFLDTYKNYIFPDLKRILVDARPSVYNRWLLSIIERTGETNVITPETLADLHKNPDLINTLDKNEVFRRDLLLAELESDIRARTPKEDVADFLMVFKHLYDVPLQPLALKWLEGSSLNKAEMESLQVNGLLQTDKQAINLIFMLAVVLEQAGVPFFFFLDELDILANQQSDAAGKEVFRSLLLTLLEDLPRFAFVMIASLEDSYNSLDTTVTSRVRLIRLSNLNTVQIEEMLDEYIAFAGGGTFRDVFEDRENALAILSQYTNGNPRKVLSIAHIAFKRSQRSNRPAISVADLADAQSDFSQLRSQDIKSIIAKILDEFHLTYVPNVSLDFGPAQLEVPFLVPDISEPQLAIYFLSAAYLQSEALKSVNSLVARTRARKHWPSIRAELLVVDGYVSLDVGSKLLSYFTYIVYVRPDRFESEIRSTLRRFAGGADKYGVRDSTAQRREDIGTLRGELAQRQVREESLALTQEDSFEKDLKSSPNPPVIQSLMYRFLGWIPSRRTVRWLNYFGVVVVLLALCWTLFQIAVRVIDWNVSVNRRTREITQLEQEANKLDGLLGKIEKGLSSSLTSRKDANKLKYQITQIDELLALNPSCFATLPSALQSAAQPSPGINLGISPSFADQIGNLDQNFQTYTQSLRNVHTSIGELFQTRWSSSADEWPRQTAEIGAQVTGLDANLGALEATLNNYDQVEAFFEKPSNYSGVVKKCKESASRKLK